jgi:hypothetical protein
VFICQICVISVPFFAFKIHNPKFKIGGRWIPDRVGNDSLKKTKEKIGTQFRAYSKKIAIFTIFLANIYQ